MNIIKTSVNLMKSKKYLFILSFILIFDSNAYEIVEDTITVTPGCEGGVLYSKIESGKLSSVSQPLNLNPKTNISTEASSEEKEDYISEEAVNKRF